MNNNLNRIVYFDTETTGTDTEDRLIQLAYRSDDSDYSGFFKPPLPIKIMAMSIHHITEKMVADCTPFEGSTASSKITRMVNRGKVFVAHNSKFDIEMLKKEGVEITKHICTLKVIKYIDAEAKLDSYKQQYLRYLAGIEVEANAHDAWGDILVLQQLFIRFHKTIMTRERLTSDQAIDKMIDISSKPSEIKRITFGKYKGMLMSEIAALDIGYIKWLLREKQGESVPDEDWIYTLEKYVRS